MSFIKFEPIASNFYFYDIIPNDQLEGEILNYIDEDEKVIYSLKSKRDFGVFTDKRIILVDKKGFRGFRKSVYTLMYESISSYVLTVKNLDATIELITDSSHKIFINFLKPIPLEDVDAVYKFITSCIIRE